MRYYSIYIKLHVYLNNNKKINIQQLIKDNGILNIIRKAPVYHRGKMFNYIYINNNNTYELIKLPYNWDYLYVLTKLIIAVHCCLLFMYMREFI